MTLIVAGISDGSIWLCSDSAVLDPVGEVRARAHGPKVEILHGKSVIGFAGSVEMGRKAIAAAAELVPGSEVLDLLHREHNDTIGPDFLYAYFENGTPQLCRISQGRVQRSNSFFIGSKEAYETYQRIRVENAADHAPNTIVRLMCASFGDANVPQAQSESIQALFQTFSSRTDREVGGWVVPYLLTSKHTDFVTYSYSVSDPLAKTLKYGEIIPDGTATEGGFSFSFCPLRERDGVVAYWLQKPGGKIFLRHGNTFEYDEFDFAGRPEVFKQAVSEKLARAVDVWHGGPDIAVPTNIYVMRDADGDDRIFVARNGNSFSFSWANNPNGSFALNDPLTIDLRETNMNENIRSLGIAVDVAEEKRGATLKIGDSCVTLTADQLDQVISELAATRMQLLDEVPRELPKTRSLVAIVDPIWRTQGAMHPSVPGPTLSLRHPGYGWQLYVLPLHEAKAIGEWLTKNAAKPAVISNEENS